MEKTYSLSFSTLKTHESSGCFFISRELTQLSCLFVGIEASQVDHVVVMSKCAKISRCLTHSSVQLCANWDARQTLSLCHRSHIEMYLSYSLHLSLHLWLYDGLVAMGSGPHFFPLEIIGAVRQDGAFNASNVAWNRSKVILLGRSNLPMVIPSSTCFRQKDIE